MADSLYLTPDDYLLAAIQRVQDLGSAITDFNSGSGARSLYEGHAAIASLQSAVAEQLRQDSYLATASGDALDRKAADSQVARKTAVAAQGTIRLTRQATGTAISIPAGWSTLLTVPVPGQTPVQFVTTADASFASGDSFKVVAAAAVEGGSSGNVPINTPLLPQNALNGFDTLTGFKAEIAFTGGVDEESDDALRARVPLEVQGRVKGRPESFLAAALRVPGVSSASVLEPGDVRASPGDGGTVAANHVEIYYQGDASLQTQIESEVESARVAGQSVTVLAGTAVSIIADLHVYCYAGTDHAAVASAVQGAIAALVNGVGLDHTGYAAAIVRAVHDVADVVTVNVPFSDLRQSTASDGTFGDLICGNVAYPAITSADIAVTVSDL